MNHIVASLQGKIALHAAHELFIIRSVPCLFLKDFLGLEA
jgi:hypothetical protein